MSRDDGSATGLRARGSRLAPSRSAQRTLLILALALSAIVSHAAFMPQQASAASRNVLIVSQPGLPEFDAGAGDASDLNMSGYTTTVTESLPTQASQLAGYSQIWYLGFHGIVAEDQERLEQYVRGGGSLYLTGKDGCCTEINESDQAIARSVLTDQSVLVGEPVLYGETPLLFNKNAADDISNKPNDLSAFPATAPGGISGIGPLDGRNVLGSNGQTAAAAVFDERDMAGGRGRLVIYMDLGWQNTEYREAFENVANFLENAPAREEPTEKPIEEPAEKPIEKPIEEPTEETAQPGKVLILTSEAPKNLQAGLDTTAELRALRYHVTLSVAPSLALAAVHRSAARARRSASQTLTPWKMPKLKDYSAVWMLAEGSPAAQGANRERLERYVKGGGRLYFGGNHVTYPSNETDQDLLRSLLHDEQITIHDSIGAGAVHFAPGALDGIAQEPNGLKEMPINNIAEISGLPSKNVLATDGELDTAAAFDEADMNNGRGRLVIYPDDWTQANPDAMQREAFVQNVQDFLEATPHRLGPRSSEYVALGDSYASGMGSYDYIEGTTGENGCFKAVHGYAEQIAANDHMSLSFQSCNGDQIGALWAGQDERTPQLNLVGPDTRAVTLTVGGDDMGFAGVFKDCLLPLHKSFPNPFECHGGLEGPAFEAEDWLRRGRKAGKYKRPGGDKSSNENWQPSLRQVYESILYQAPGAELVVIGYPYLMESEEPLGVPLLCDITFPSEHSLPLSIKAGDVEWIKKTTDEVDLIIEQAVKEARNATGGNIRFADPRPRYHGHALCDSPLHEWYLNMLHINLSPEEFLIHINKPNIEKFINREPESLHPNVVGQNVLRELIEEVAQEF